MNQTKNQITTAPEQFVLRRRIGSTVYEVSCYLNPDAKETMDDKIMRLVQNDLHFSPENATMTSLQTGRLPERESA